MKNTDYTHIPQFKIGNRHAIIQTSLHQLDVPWLISTEYCSGIDSQDDWICSTEITPDNAFYICSDKLLHTSHFPHQHNYYEIMIVLEGEVIQMIEDKEYLYSAGSACLVNRNILHTEKLIGKTRLLFIGLSVSFITTIMDIYKTPLFHKDGDFLSTGLWQFFANDIRNLHQKVYIDFFPFVTDKAMEKTLYQWAEKLLQVSLFPDSSTTINIMAMVCTLFQLFCDPTQFHVSLMPININADYLLFRHISHILEEKNGQISRQELQEIIHYTADYMGRIVKKYSGKNFYDYSMDFKMKRICDLITQTDEPISTILEKNGITNRNHFYKLFRKKYKMTPNAYRKQRGKQKE